MKLVKLTLIVSLSLLAAVAASAASHDALKSVPQNQLQGVQILSCEEKEPTSTVSCRSTGKCTITVVTGRVSCKGIRK